MNNTTKKYKHMFRFLFLCVFGFHFRERFRASRSLPLLLSSLSSLLYALRFIYILLLKVIAPFFSVSHFTHFYSYSLFYLVRASPRVLLGLYLTCPALSPVLPTCFVIIIHFALNFIKYIITSLIAMYIFRLGVNFRRP